MPPLVAAYLALYVTFCVWAHSTDFGTNGPTSTYVIAEICGELALLAAALSYWLLPLRALPGPVLLMLYLSGCASFVIHAWGSARRQLEDPDLPMRGKLFVLSAGATLGVAVSMPLLVWGWQAAMLSSYAEV